MKAVVVFKIISHFFLTSFKWILCFISCHFPTQQSAAPAVIQFLSHALQHLPISCAPQTCVALANQS